MQILRSQSRDQKPISETVNELRKSAKTAGEAILKSASLVGELVLVVLRNTATAGNSKAITAKWRTLNKFDAAETMDEFGYLVAVAFTTVEDTDLPMEDVAEGQRRAQ